MKHKCPDPDCDKEYENKKSWHGHLFHYPEHRPDDWQECQDCGKRYQRIGKHWATTDCEYPELTEEQHEIVTGLLMGDGSVAHHTRRSNPWVQVTMTEPEYLTFLDSKFPELGTGVTLTKTAAEKAQENRESGWRPDAKAEDYSDQYTWTTLAVPDLWEYREWYSRPTGKKRWPISEIDLTPIVLKHWYVGDGNYTNNDSDRYIRISTSNERDRTDEIDEMFERAGLPKPDKWANYTTGERDVPVCYARWHVESSTELFEYMGDAPPGFGYKWPNA